MAPIAILRSVPDSFVACVTSAPADPPLDATVARRQHGAYRQALEDGGFQTVMIPADEAHPDGSFAEDAAVVIGDKALATRPGHPSRRGEVGPVAAELGRFLVVEAMAAPECLDGGDVLQLGGEVFVGSSSRTNSEGIERLRRFAAGRTVTPVEVAGVLHLKSAVTALDDRTLLMEPGLVDPAVFGAYRIIETAPDEPHAANVVRLADGSILAAAHTPETAAAVAAAGFEVRQVDVSEFARADGGLTCLSIRIRGG